MASGRLPSTDPMANRNRLNNDHVRAGNDDLPGAHDAHGSVWLNDLVVAILGSGNAGAGFFGPLALGPGQTTANGEPSIGFVLAAQVLPAVIFFAALMAVLYHLRLIQPVVTNLRPPVPSHARSVRRRISWRGLEHFLRRRVRDDDPALSGADDPLRVADRADLLHGDRRLDDAGRLRPVPRGCFPQIAGHLISASVLSIPAAAMVSKLMLPETEEPETLGRCRRGRDRRGTATPCPRWRPAPGTACKLAAGIAYLLIAVLGVVALIDLGLTAAQPPFAGASGRPVDLGRLLGWIFTPVAWLLGIESGDLTPPGGCSASDRSSPRSRPIANWPDWPATARVSARDRC